MLRPVRHFATQPRDTDATPDGAALPLHLNVISIYPIERQQHFCTFAGIQHNKDVPRPITVPRWLLTDFEPRPIEALIVILIRDFAEQVSGLSETPWKVEYRFVTAALRWLLAFSTCWESVSTLYIVLRYVIDVSTSVICPVHSHFEKHSSWSCSDSRV